MMTKPHPHQEHTKKGLIIPLITVLLFSLCTKVVAQQKDKKRKVHLQTNLLYLKLLRQNYFKVKDENGKVIADKKYADLTVKEKT
jgi:hypothetical protein